MALYDFRNARDRRKIDFKGYDATVIGCGAIGIFIALELSRSGLKVLVLESGGHGEVHKNQELNQVVTERSDMKSSAEWGRKRAIGGTTIKWGGQAVPFKKIDFEKRTWLGSLPQWPFGLDALRPHYQKAESYLGLDGRDYFKDIRNFRAVDPLNSDKFDFHVSKWAPEPNMFKKHKRSLLASCDILFHAHCIGVRERGRECTHVQISSTPGEADWIPVKRLFLANGGLESTRFLLLHFPKVSERIGQGFMEHPCMTCAEIEVKKSKALQKAFAVRFIRGRRYGLRLSLSEEYMRNAFLSNASFGLMFESPNDVFDPYRERLSVISLSGVLGSLRNLKALLTSLRILIAEGWVYRSFAKVRLVVMSEQLWSEENALKLDKDAVDRFNQPLLTIEWNPSPKTWETITTSTSELLKELKRKFPEIASVAAYTEDGALWQTRLTPVNHHMGGALMGEVVDESLKLKGLSNVYVCGSAVFPSSGHSNPTLTAIALASKALEDGGLIRKS